MSSHETEVGSNTVSNDNLTVHVTRNPHCQIKFEVTVTPEAVEAAYQKALKAINKEVNIPGFRKGKAPIRFIIEKYESTIQKECIDIVLQTGFNEALQLTQIHPLKDGAMKRPVVHECSREKGAHFILEFEARPVIPAIQPETLHLTKVEPAEITEEQRTNALQQVLLQFTTYEPIEDRPVQEGDFIDLDITVLEETPRQIVTNQRTQVNETGLPVWMKDKVIGLQAGESAEGQTEPNPHTPDSAFQPVSFRVTVNAIWQGILPPVDDTLAQKVGLQTLEELHKKIHDRLEEETQEDIYKQHIHQLENQLVDTYPIDLPLTYIDINKQAALDNYIEQLKENQQDGYAQESYKEIEKVIEESTIHNLQLFFLLRRLAFDHNLEVSDEDISQELTKQIALIPSGRSQINLHSNKQELYKQLCDLALDRKIKQFLLDHATWS